MSATVVLVHGAWHGAWCWDLVAAGLLERDTDVVAVDLPGHGDDTGSCTDLSGDVAFVLGSEREGLPAEVAASCDAQATIPVEPGAESLNVAAAAALALYERRRRG